MAWLASRPTRGALHPTPLAEASLHRHRARSAVAALECRNQSFLVPWRAPAHASPRGESADRPQSMCASGLGAQPTRGALHSTPLAEAPLRLHCARSPAPTSNRRSHYFLVPWRVARARFVTRRTSRPPTEHVCWRTWRAANSRRAPPHAVGRGSFAPTPHPVGGCGFEPS